MIHAFAIVYLKKEKSENEQQSSEFWSKSVRINFFSSQKCPEKKAGTKIAMV